MVIVTENQYILAQKIHHITMDERVEYAEIRSSAGRYRTIKDSYYQILVYYTPEVTAAGHHNGREDIRECQVTVRGHVNAHRLFKSLVSQIREQMPDELYLNKALEDMLAGIDEKNLELKDNDDRMCLKEDSSVASTKKVRRTRKAKRTGKAVLRKSKKRR